MKFLVMSRGTSPLAALSYYKGWVKKWCELVPKAVACLERDIYVIIH